MKLITAAECVRKMRQAGIYKGKESYFSQLVQKGVIPFHEKEGSPKKWYVLEEVKKALKGWEDPTRDSQREENEKRRKLHQPSEPFSDDEFTRISKSNALKIKAAEQLHKIKYIDLLAMYDVKDSEEISDIYLESKSVAKKLAAVWGEIQKQKDNVKYPNLFSMDVIKIEEVLLDQFITLEDIEEVIQFCKCDL